MAINFFSAFLLPPLASGWCFLAKNLYRDLMWSADANWSSPNCARAASRGVCGRAFPISPKSPSGSSKRCAFGLEPSGQLGRSHTVSRLRISQSVPHSIPKRSSTTDYRPEHDQDKTNGIHATVSAIWVHDIPHPIYIQAIHITGVRRSNCYYTAGQHIGSCGYATCSQYARLI